MVVGRRVQVVVGEIGGDGDERCKRFKNTTSDEHLYLERQTDGDVSPGSSIKLNMIS